MLHRRNPIALSLALAALGVSLGATVGNMRSAGLWLGLLTGVVAGWILITLLLLVRSHGRSVRLSRLLILVPTVLLAGAASGFLERKAAESGAAVATAIENHKARSGSFPQSLEEVDPNVLRHDEPARIVYKGLRDGTALLYYHSPTQWLTSYHYDFTSRRWIRSD